jgi:hypothetical protein
VIIAGPGSALERLFVPLFGSVDDPTQRLSDLAFGIPLGVLLVPGLGLWAWGARLRPSGVALSSLATLAVSFDLAFEGGLTMFGWALLTALWLLVTYQLLTFRTVDTVVRRPPVLMLAVLACVAPWIVQAGRLLAQSRTGALDGDHIFVVVLTVVLSLLLVLPLVRLESFAAAGVVAAVGAVIFALMSLLWETSAVALPRFVAVPAVAAAIAYVDTIRHMKLRSRRSGDREPTAGDGSPG